MIDNGRMWLWRRDGWYQPMVIEVPGKGLIPTTDCDDADLRAAAEEYARPGSEFGLTADWWERRSIEARERERQRLERARRRFSG